MVKTLCVLGAAGGVGQALLSLCARHPIGTAVLAEYEDILLVDAVEPASVAFLEDIRLPVRSLWGRSLATVTDFRNFVSAYRPAMIAEVADIETRDLLEVCCETGVNYIGTGYGVSPATYRDAPDDPRTCILHRAQELLHRHTRYAPQQSRCVVGSGMNPGVVNVLAAWATHKDRFGPLGNREKVVRVTLTEEETFRSSEDSLDAMIMTWNPLHAFWEFTEKHTGYCKQRNVVSVAGQPCFALAPASIHGRSIEGMIVPHEEVVTLADLFPNAVVQFVYSVPAPVLSYVRASACRPEPERYRMDRKPLSGYDHVGVSIEWDQGHSIWCGYKNDHRDGLPYDTNATLMQVAAGVLGGMRALPTLSPGVYLPEELDPEIFLATVDAVLGRRETMIGGAT